MNDEANTVATSVMKTTPFTLRRTDRGADLDLDLDLEPILSTRMVAMAMEMAWRAPSLRTAFDRGESLGETSRPCFDVEKPSADGTTRRLGGDKEGAPSQGLNLVRALGEGWLGSMGIAWRVKGCEKPALLGPCLARWRVGLSTVRS